MREVESARPVVTVATIVERDGAFLLVEEETPQGLRFNQPAGHLERGETLPAAALRETLEETGWHVDIGALVGVYRWEHPETGVTFVRFAFAAGPRRHDAGRALDAGILRAVWLTYDEICAHRARHRSPMVLACVDDYRAGRRWPLALVTELGA
jgi:ADP-ribose pyrophosphatase YjhB (NUDIX family)